ncbi:hypothetical protein [Streptomyces sp. NPDC018055]|uniref:hypothetical protein n=1 Tax=Streptomyces sp. NPDC018055 TaxID=3365038 RepID=UPI003798F65D
MPDSPWKAAPRCTFYVRTSVTEDPPTYNYDQAYLPNGYAHLVYPPAVGDLVYLRDTRDRKEADGPFHTGAHRVIERAWTHPAYGSADWPWGEPHPQVGPILDLIVVKDEGPFRNEA